ncbi:TPA: YdcF family protein [Streptococcus suis]
MKNYLLEKGISEHNIIMEDQSTTTLENMMFSKKNYGSDDVPVPCDFCNK